MTSEEAEEHYLKACRDGRMYKMKNELWHKWQDLLKAEGKFHVKGKEVVEL
jgi:uncharacterized protein YifE (UPF0438 family)